MELIPMHRTVSREVTPEDLPRVMEDAEEMARMCHGPRKAYALAHSQVTKEDPLRFFAMSDGSVVVNPSITRHVAFKREFDEGCMSIPDVPSFPVRRWTKITADYCLMEDGRLVKKTHEFTGLSARIFQHEIDHMDGRYVCDAAGE